MKIMWFCIPAFGHTNPSVEVVRELTRRGHEVRYYSFEMFRDKLTAAGAEFIPCDEYLPPVDDKALKRIKNVSTTEMTVQSFGTTARMDERLTKDIADFQPDGIVSDSACFWGKLTAAKHGLPLVVSTSTFAFNKESAKYMKQSFSEMADLILGMPRMLRAMEALRPLGYKVKSPLDIVSSDNDTNTIVYTSARFQPCAESFNAARYRFVGPSVREVPLARQEGQRPLVYVSLGTVINDRPGFYRHCVDAARGSGFDMLISCGEEFDISSLGTLPENVHVEPTVDQMEVLSRAKLFLTHCGMNSASEGLYMGVPELLFPLTGEQEAVARRVKEVGAGVLLTKYEAASARGIRSAICTALMSELLPKAAMDMRADFHACSGPRGAADFIEEVFG